MPYDLTNPGLLTFPTFPEDCGSERYACLRDIGSGNRMEKGRSHPCRRRLGSRFSLAAAKILCGETAVEIQSDGGDGNDTLYGGSEGDWLFGEANDDMIIGDDGDDAIVGGAGIDTLYGGLRAVISFTGTAFPRPECPRGLEGIRM